MFRRFGTRAGIFQALLDDDERDFQQRVLSGPPPLGPGAAPLDRLIAYGRARIDFLAGHRDIARAAPAGTQPVPAGAQTPVSRTHIPYLLQEMHLAAADLDVLALQLTSALDGPMLLYLSGSEDAARIIERLGRGWEDISRRVGRPLTQRRPACGVPRDGPGPRTALDDMPCSESQLQIEVNHHRGYLLPSYGVQVSTINSKRVPWRNGMPGGAGETARPRPAARHRFRH